jgi:2'-5' RNA ligase
MMRVFIAIDIGDKIRKQLGDLQQRLIDTADIKKSDVKWVKPENIHLTLKFLGEIEDERTVEVCNIVKDVAGKHSSFEINVESVGCFGGRSARILWVGAGEGNENLLKLQNDLEEQLALAGWPKETRDFSGHLTICRIKNPKAGLKLAQISKDYRDLKLGTISADAVSVYQSRLTPTGPVYTLLCSYKLR